MVEAYQDAFGSSIRDVHGAPNAPEDSFEYNPRKENELVRDVYEKLLGLVRATSPISFDSSFDRTDSGSPVLPQRAQFVKKVSLRGVKYSTRDSAVNNSFILFHVGDDIHAAQIDKIFYHCRREDGTLKMEAFIVVEEYIPLTIEHEPFDPYRGFEELNTRVYYNKFKPQSTLIRLEDIQSHFAAYMYTPEGIDQVCIVARSLDRVIHFAYSHMHKL